MRHLEVNCSTIWGTIKSCSILLLHQIAGISKDTQYSFSALTLSWNILKSKQTLTMQKKHNTKVAGVQQKWWECVSHTALPLHLHVQSCCILLSLCIKTDYTHLTDHFRLKSEYFFTLPCACEMLMLQQLFHYCWPNAWEKWDRVPAPPGKHI